MTPLRPRPRSNAGFATGRLPARRKAPAAPGRRLRAIGVLVLLLGFGAAGILYWLGTHQAGPTMEELMPGYSQANSRQTGILFGHAGVLMWEWREDLERPETQAVIIVVVAALVALGCFRAAWLDAEGEGWHDGRR